MATGTGTILELRLEAGELSGWIACPPGLRPAPGQYLVASSPAACEPLPTILFPGGTHPSNSKQPGLYVAPPLPAAWTAGMELTLHGPFGNGFHLPPAARQVALANLHGAPFRLLPLIEQALNQRAAVAIYANITPAGLSEEVEVLPPDLLPEAPGWADFLALEAGLSELKELRARLGLKAYQRLACQAEVLVTTAMPCSGLADCGVCAVATRSGWKLACSDGPVFDFNLLEGS